MGGNQDFCYFLQKKMTLSDSKSNCNFFAPSLATLKFSSARPGLDETLICTQASISSQTGPTETGDKLSILKFFFSRSFNCLSSVTNKTSCLFFQLESKFGLRQIPPKILFLQKGALRQLTCPGLVLRNNF